MSATDIQVLLIVGEPSRADQIMQMLDASDSDGFTLVHTPTLEQARQQLDQNTFDVVLTDLNLSDSRGLDTLAKLQEFSPRTPVVVVSEDQGAPLDDEARRLGAHDFLFHSELRPRLLSRVLRFAVDRASYARRLKTSEEINRLLIEQAQDIIYRVDLEGRFRFINPAAEKITGYDSSELIGQSFLYLIAPEHRQRVMEFYLQQIAQGVATSYLEFPILTKDGQARWIGQNVWVAKLEDSSPGFEAIARDITDLHQALARLEKIRNELEERVAQRTKELEQARLTWERTFHAVPDLVMVTDSDLKITNINHAAAAQAKMSQEALLGCDARTVLPGLSALCVLPAPDGQPAMFSREVHDQASNAYFLVSSSPITQEDGYRVGHVHVARDISQLKQAEKALTEQLGFLQKIIDAIPNPVFFKNKEGIYTLANTAFLEYSGLKAQELLGKDVSCVLDHQQAEEIKAKDRQLMAEGGIHIYETIQMRDSGKVTHAIDSKVVLRDSNGEAQGLVGVLLDVTELRQAEKALRASEEQFRSLFEQAPIALWEEDFSQVKLFLDQLVAGGVQDLQAYFTENPAKLFHCASLVKILNINTFTLAMFEAGDKQELLSNLGKIFTKESLPAFLQELLALHRGDKTVSIAGYNRTIKGRQLYVQINVSVAPGAETTWDRILVSVQDLTDRLEAESAMRESEKRYRTLVEALTEGLVQVDENLVIRFCNKRFRDLLGYEKEEIIGASLLSLTDQEAKQQLEKQFAKRRQGISEPYELTLRNKSGQPVKTQVSPRPVFDADGVFRGSFSLMTDVTNLKKLEYQLRQSQKMEAIGQLAAGIAHEINTPTQYVASNSKFLQEGFKDLAELQNRTLELLAKSRGETAFAEETKALEAMIQEIDLEFLLEEIPKALEANLEGLERIAVIVRSMKDFAHPGREEKQATDLNQIIESTVTVARNEWKYVAHVETDLDPNLPLVYCVANEIKQVILNMVVNAAQAIGEIVTEGVDEKGAIKITSRVDGSQALITISDTGAGIPPELREKVFDPFFTTKEPGKGTGQGLAIAYRAVVDTHGGSLNLKSQVGQGTTFEIRLPLGDQEAQ